MKRMRTLSVLAAVGFLAGAPVWGKEPAADKAGYTLFNPTPPSLLREFSPDRPDTTESPYTVDAGHFQVELSFLEYAHDRDRGVGADSLSLLPVNLKVGLLNNVDLQLVVNPYLNQRVKSRGAPAARDEGAGDTLLRLKVNLLGNDGGPFAFGVMPFVKIPTATGDLGNGKVEGGLIFAVAMELPAGFDAGAMIEIDAVRDAANRGYGAAVLHTLTLGHKLYGDLGAYVEYAGTTFIDAGQSYQAVLGTGLTLGLGENVQLDGGVNVALSHSAEDYRLFVGLSFRL